MPKISVNRIDDEDDINYTPKTKPKKLQREEPLEKKKQTWIGMNKKQIR
jgi:hypothetical protein